jgi:hypothetical protein
MKEYIKNLTKQIDDLNYQLTIAELLQDIYLEIDSHDGISVELRRKLQTHFGYDDSE